MKQLCVPISLLCAAWLMACQSPPPLTFVVTTGNPAWTVWHASPQPEAILSLATQGDRLWAGTSFGVWQIDLQTRQIARYDAQIGAVLLLLPIEDGQVWASAFDGLFFFDRRQWRNIELPNHLEVGGVGSARHIDMIAVDDNGGLALRTSPGRWGIYTARYSGHLPANVEGDPMPDINAVILDPLNCQLWPLMASYEAGKNHRSSAECLALQDALQTLVPAPHVNLRWDFDGDGSLWVVGPAKMVLTHWANGKSSTIKLPLDVRVNALTSDPTRGIWLGTNRGLMYTDGQMVYQMPNLDQSFIGGNPRDLAVESAGAVWVLTAESRLSWLQPGSSTFEVVPGVNARAIAAAADGVWITHGNDLIHLKLGDPMPATIFPPIPDCKLDRLTTDRAGDVWATTRCGLAWQYQPIIGRWTRHMLDIPMWDEGAFDNIQSIVAGIDGTVYAISSTGVGLLTEPGDKITETVNSPNTAPPYATYRHHAFSLSSSTAPLSNGPSAADRQGGVWLTTSDRYDLWHYMNGQFTVLEHPFGNTWITTLQVDQSNRLWAANLFNRLAVYDGQQWRTFATPGIGAVFHIVPAPDGRVWFVGSGGVAVYDPTKDK